MRQFCDAFMTKKHETNRQVNLMSLSLHYYVMPLKRG
jgi:hypothetical protein